MDRAEIGHLGHPRDLRRRGVLDDLAHLNAIKHEEFADPEILTRGLTLNGISLTVFNVKKSSFSVAIIPYTFTHTNIQFVEPGTKVNIEFDILGKYLLRKNTLG